MGIDEIRQVVQSRPFKAFELHMDNGERHMIKHPENVFITPQLIVTVTEQNKTLLIAPEAVSTILVTDGKRQVPHG